MNITSKIINIPSYLRWRTKPVRKLSKLFNQYKRLNVKTTNLEIPLIDSNPIQKKLMKDSYVKLDKVNIPDINISKLKGVTGKQAFVDVSEEYWKELKQVTLNLIEDDYISDAIVKYFDGKPWLWNIALNYSEPRDKQIGSQLWHFDYGDIKQLHIMVYFNEVDIDTGPFTFLKQDISSKIKRSKLFIERLTDEDLLDNYKIDVQDLAIRLTGKPGDAFLADPGKLIHQGARCTKPRLVAFLTFTTTAPMSLGGKNIISYDLRKDLFTDYSKRDSNHIFKKDFFF